MRKSWDVFHISVEEEGGGGKDPGITPDQWVVWWEETEGLESRSDGKRGWENGEILGGTRRD